MPALLIADSGFAPPEASSSNYPTTVTTASFVENMGFEAQWNGKPG
jgi:hypothetical protein